MFGKKKVYKEGAYANLNGDRAVSNGLLPAVEEHIEVITERDRGPADAAKVETMVWLLGKIANEHLDPVFVTLLQECKDLGYNLVDEPQALLERLKRQF